MPVQHAKRSGFMLSTLRACIDIGTCFKGKRQNRRHGTTYRVPRVAVDWSVQIYCRTHGAAPGRIINASESGVLILSPRRFDVGGTVALTIDTGSGRGLRCLAEVTRGKRLFGDFYAYGARYTSWTGNDHRLLIHYLERLLDKN